MRSQGRILIGTLIIIAGVLLLLGAVFDINVGLFCFPVGLILLGIWLLFRPQMVGPETGFRVAFFGPVRRDGRWQVTDQEIWLAVGDVRLDLGEADIPSGVTDIRIFAFVADVRLLLPPGVGAAISSTSFVSDIKLFDRKREGIVAPVHMSSDGYDEAQRKVHLETVCFVAEVKVEPSTTYNRHLPRTGVGE